MINGIVVSLLFCFSLAMSLATIYLQLKYREACREMDLNGFYKMKKIDNQKALTASLAATSFSAFVVYALLITQ